MQRRVYSTNYSLNSPIVRRSLPKAALPRRLDCCCTQSQILQAPTSYCSGQESPPTSPPPLQQTPYSSHFLPLSNCKVFLAIGMAFVNLSCPPPKPRVPADPKPHHRKALWLSAVFAALCAIKDKLANGIKPSQPPIPTTPPKAWDDMAYARLRNRPKLLRHKVESKSTNLRHYHQVLLHHQ